MSKILIIGACGQLGTELTLRLRELKGKENIVATDLRGPVDVIADGPFEVLDILDKSLFGNCPWDKGNWMAFTLWDLRCSDGNGHCLCKNIVMNFDRRHDAKAKNKCW